MEYSFPIFMQVERVISEITKLILELFALAHGIEHFHSTKYFFYVLNFTQYKAQYPLKVEEYDKNGDVGWCVCFE